LKLELAVVWMAVAFMSVNDEGLVPLCRPLSREVSRT